MSDTTKVVFDLSSTIGDFTYGEFSGHAYRRPAKPAGWCSHRREMRDAEPACWLVTVYGVERAWREVRVPPARGRTLAKAVELACGLYKSPADIKPDAHGQFGEIVHFKEKATESCT